MRRSGNPVAKAFYLVAIGVVVLTVLETKSRGGQLSVALVFGVYFIRRFGVLALLPAGLLGVALMMLGGRSDASSDMSTQLRYEAWATGIAMFRDSPIFGVGTGSFTDHHFLTAHNSFVLALAELGFPGLVLFVAMVYISLKSLLVGLRQLSLTPGAEVVQVWGMALLASFAAILFQINTLSFAYKSVLWIFFGLVGAWTGAIRHHRPEFTVRLTWRDLLFIVVGCLAYVFVVLPLFLRYKGEM
ncbi:MAG: O-antigen ligase family protein [Kofleriaceae bacterium]